MDSMATVSALNFIFITVMMSYVKDQSDLHTTLLHSKEGGALHSIP